MRVFRLASCFLGLVWGSVVVGCSSGEAPSTTQGAGGSGGQPASGGGGAGGEPGPLPGADTVVTPFDKTHIYFTGDDNKREVDQTATFPTEGTYERITLHLALDCPQGGCDSWDRFATLGIVSKKGQNGEPDQVIELARYITPYKVTAAWDIDVTDLRPLFSGEITLRTFIDTWVGPGSPYGAGWLVTARFEMKGGTPPKLPISVTPVWTRTSAAYGDPAKPMTDVLPDQMLALPEGSSFALRTFITGHGQGNKGNCAEFCKRIHTLTVQGIRHDQEIWRADCATTAVPNQQGTWKYARAGWCPGADVRPWLLDVTADLTGAAEASVAYEVEEYENTCRPDAAVCAGCTLGTGCDYDGGAHTEPNYQVSTVLIGYK